jgi:hypothetical protein
MPSPVIRTPINEKYIDDEGFLRMKVIDGVQITVDNLKEDMSVNKELTGGKKICVLYDARPNFLITVQAREFLQTEAFNADRLATAVITNKLGVRIMVNFMTRVKKTVTPLRVFSNEEKALKWLRSFGK